MRALAAEHGMTIEKFAAYNREHPDKGHDRMCDEMIARFAEHSYVVCDGRLPHCFMPEAWHVLLLCDPHERARRRKLQEGHEHLSEEEIYEQIMKRDEDDDNRYAALYGPECLWTPERYDIVVDNTELSREVTLARVLKGYTEWTDRLVSA